MGSDDGWTDVMKKIRQILSDFSVATVQAFWVVLSPYRTNRRLRYLQSQVFDINAYNEDLQVEIESLERKVKFFKRDLKESWQDNKKALKSNTMMKKWILTMHRLDIPRRAGGIDELISRANEIQEPEENSTTN